MAKVVRHGEAPTPRRPVFAFANVLATQYVRCLNPQEPAAMLSIAIDPETEARLAAIAASTGDAPDEIARRALFAYLEDLEDYATAVEAWKEFDEGGRVGAVSGEELLKRYDLEA